MTEIITPYSESVRIQAYHEKVTLPAFYARIKDCGYRPHPQYDAGWVGKGPWGRIYISVFLCGDVDLRAYVEFDHILQEEHPRVPILSWPIRREITLPQGKKDFENAVIRARFLATGQNIHPDDEPPKFDLWGDPIPEKQEKRY